MILSDYEIEKLCTGDKPMTSPFVGEKTRMLHGKKVPSFGIEIVGILATQGHLAVASGSCPACRLHGHGRLHFAGKRRYGVSSYHSGYRHHSFFSENENLAKAFFKEERPHEGN